MRLQKTNEKGETLFCACLEIYSMYDKLWRAKTEYFHAKDSGHAKALICLAHPNRAFVRIVGIAPAIGFHVEDEHGERLRA